MKRVDQNDFEMKRIFTKPDLVKADQILRAGAKDAHPLADLTKSIVEDMRLPSPTENRQTRGSKLPEKLSLLADALGKVSEYVGEEEADKPSSIGRQDAKKTLDGELGKIKSHYSEEISKNQKLIVEAKDEIETALRGNDAGEIGHFSDLFGKFSALGQAGSTIAMIGTIVLLGFAGSASALAAPWFGVAALLVGLVGAFGGVALEAFKAKFPVQYQKIQDALPESVKGFISPQVIPQAVSGAAYAKKREGKQGLA